MSETKSQLADLRSTLVTPSDQQARVCRLISKHNNDQLATNHFMDQVSLETMGKMETGWIPEELDEYVYLTWFYTEDC
jgi:hypothetical protein